MAESKSLKKTKKNRPEAVVYEFLTACEQKDFTKLDGLLADSAVYHNVPLPIIKGRRRIVGTLKRMMGPVDEFKVKFLFVAERDGAVLTERIDTIVMRGIRLDLPVMGTFEVKDGKVTAWRDYFDLLMILRALPVAVGEMLGKWSGR